jgi:RNA polymerase sigma factor (sigma-70 family)
MVVLRKALGSNFRQKGYRNRIRRRHGVDGENRRITFSSRLDHAQPLMEAAPRPEPGRPEEPRLERELQRLRPFGEAYLMRNFGDQLIYADAEDAVSDVTLRIHRQIAAGHPPENLQSVFLTGCKNAAIDRLRWRARKPTVALEAAVDTPTPLPAPEELAERREVGSRMREVLARISRRQRQVLILRFGLELTVPEIAGQMGISLPAAKNLLARGIEQARRRVEAIEGERFCPEIQSLLRSAVVDKDLCGLASDDEQRELHAHLDHCGTCKSFLASLHDDFASIGPAALLAASTANRGLLTHLAAHFDHALSGLQVGIAKVRLGAYKLGGAFNGDAGGAGGALGTTSQKILAICGTATATTATCLATGIVGPGIGVLNHHQRDPGALHHKPSTAQVRLISELPPEPTQPEPEEAPTAEPAPVPAAQPKPPSQPSAEPEPEPEPAPTPAQQSAEEFGIESTAPPPEPEPEPQPSSAPSAPAPSGGGGGGENFGFGG